ncbi:MAG: septation protein SepH, partial [Sporichthyaceae bacterium]
MGDAADGAPKVTDLRLVSVTDGRGHLVLEDDQSNQFRVPVDERLANALRSPERPRSDGPRRDGQLEIALESQLSPREIQARVRAGHSVDEVAIAAGISTERVERYAVPVLAERQHVVELAQRAPGRRASAGLAPALAEVVEARLAEQNVAVDSLAWDAWRGDDGRWVVSVTYPGTARDRVA